MRQEMEETERPAETWLKETNGVTGSGAIAPLHDATPVATEVDKTGEVGKEMPHLLAIGRETLHHMRQLLEQNAQAVSVDFVHDLRVATRRLSEVVRIVATLMDGPAAKAVANALRETRQSTGALRDLDVLDEHLQRWRFPAALKAVKEEILRQHPVKRESLTQQLREQLNSASLAGAQAVLAHVLEDQANEAPECQEKLENVLRKQIKRRHKQLRAAFGRAARKQTPTALHQARIRAKKLRYALELAHQTGLEHCQSDLKFLKRVQKELGEMHDADVIVDTLQEHLAQLPAEKSAKARPAWRQWDRDLQKKQARRAAAFFAKSYLWMNREH